MEAFEINNTDLSLIVLSGGLLLIQLIYFLGLYIRLWLHGRSTEKNPAGLSAEFPPLSVIICSRNESENLRKYLPAILEQDYPQFEVIVINDGSTDESEAVLSAFEEKYSHLYHSFTPDSARYISRKKLALTLGIKASKYQWLVFTEANCYPLSKNWLRCMARNFTPATDIVLGYSGYEQEKRWLNKLVSFDGLFQSIRFMGLAIAGRPYMGIGRNMAYRKELFFKNKGYSSHLNLQRGDDDLFINELATGDNTRVEAGKESVIRISPVKYYKEWKEEKVSYTATSRYYKGMQRYLTGFETLSRILFYLSIVTTLIVAGIEKHWLIAGLAILAWLIRYIVQGIVVNNTARQLGESRRYYFTLPVFDLLLPWNAFKFRLYRWFRGKGDFMRR